MKEFTLQKYRDIGDILTDSFGYIRMHWKSLGKGLLYFVLPFYLVSGILVGNTYNNIFSATLDNPEAVVDSFIGYDFWFGLLLMALGTAAILLVTLKHIQLAKYNVEVKVMELLDDFAMNLFILLALYFITMFAVGISMLFFIIPGIYVGVKLFVSPAVAIIEDCNPFDAIERSWELVQGHWWTTFGVFVVMYIITSFMSYVLVVPFSMIVGFMTASGAAEAGSSVGMIMGIFYGLTMVVTALFSVILIISMALHYFNLVERKEGTGLKSQIEQLG